MKHALRNSLITITTIVGLQMGALISGVVVTEQIFAIPGFGKLTLDTIQTRDYALLQGVVLVSAAGYVIVNLSVDLLYSFLNPRIRVAGAAHELRRSVDRRRAQPARAAQAADAEAVPPPAVRRDRAHGRRRVHRRAGSSRR